MTLTPPFAGDESARCRDRWPLDGGLPSRPKGCRLKRGQTAVAKLHCVQPVSDRGRILAKLSRNRSFYSDGFFDLLSLKSLRTKLGLRAVWITKDTTIWPEWCRW
jgi:hypothetical protein